MVLINTIYNKKSSKKKSRNRTIRTGTKRNEMRNNADKIVVFFLLIVYMLELHNQMGITARQIEQKKRGKEHV